MWWQVCCVMFCWLHRNFCIHIIFYELRTSAWTVVFPRFLGIRLFCKFALCDWNPVPLHWPRCRLSQWTCVTPCVYTRSGVWNTLQVTVVSIKYQVHTILQNVRISNAASTYLPQTVVQLQFQFASSDFRREHTTHTAELPQLRNKSDLRLQGVNPLTYLCEPCRTSSTRHWSWTFGWRLTASSRQENVNSCNPKTGLQLQFGYFTCFANCVEITILIFEVSSLDDVCLSQLFN